MTINTNSIISAIIASLVTLLCVYFLKPAFLIQQSNQPLSSNDISTIADSSEGVKQTNIEEIPTQVCEQDCIQQVVDNMLSGENLEDEFGGSALNETQILKVAEYLATKPELINKLEQTLTTTKSQGARDSIVLTFGQLPESHIKRVAENLTSSKQAVDRNDGIYLLYSAAESDIDAESKIRNIIKNDPDDLVALNAIGALQTLDPSFVGDITKQRLTAIFNSENEEAQIQALIAKVQLIEISDETKKDISIALNSKSEEFQKMGLRVLEDILGQQSGGSLQGDWVKDQNLKSTVESIANDIELSPYSRVDALNILNIYYRN